MIIDELITDRTQADVDLVESLKAKWLDGTITNAEKTTWNAGMKGAYNAADLNRVGEAVAYVANLMNSSGRTVTVTAKQNWTYTDIPTQAQMTAFLNDLSILKSNSGISDAVPSSMDYLTYQTANAIEQLIINAYNAIIRERANYEISGIAISGVTGGL